jgi:hypothetical protein
MVKPVEPSSPSNPAGGDGKEKYSPNEKRGPSKFDEILEKEKSDRAKEEIRKMAEKARAEPYKGKAYADTGPAVSEKTNRPFGGAGGMGAMPKSGVKRTPEYKSGGKVSSASKRADGCVTKGKTKGRMI